MPTPIATTGATDTTTTPATGGSADGVPWTGDWNAQFYGAGDRATTIVAPSGVAGQFRAQTSHLSGTNTDYMGVVGAFGATRDEN